MPNSFHPTLGWIWCTTFLCPFHGWSTNRSSNYLLLLANAVVKHSDGSAWLHSFPLFITHTHVRKSLTRKLSLSPMAVFMLRFNNLLVARGFHSASSVSNSTQRRKLLHNIRNLPTHLKNPIISSRIIQPKPKSKSNSKPLKHAHNGRNFYASSVSALIRNPQSMITYE